MWLQNNHIFYVLCVFLLLVFAHFPANTSLHATMCSSFPPAGKDPHNDSQATRYGCLLPSRSLRAIIYYMLFQRVGYGCPSRALNIFIYGVM